MVADAELVQRLRDFLRSSDLSTTTAAIVRRKLEEDFGVDLTEKKAFIREQIDLFLGELNEKEEEDEEGEDVKVEKEEGGSSGQEEEEEEVEEDEEGEEKEEGSSNSSGSRKRSSNKLTVEVKKRGGGFTKLCSLSPLLQEFVGAPELARTEVVKRLWIYIRENNLQDPSNKRKIICDERLQSLFKVNMIDMFQMNKVLAKHIHSLSSEDGSVKSPNEKPKKKVKEDVDASRKGKKQKGGNKGGNTGFLAPLPLSDALTKFIGTGEDTLPRSDVIKRIWVYIKQNNLQDPADKRNIICDDKLRELFQVGSFNGFTVTKLLAAHFVKTK
ncbi:upstream activation factor subunit spp27-like isoform X2 [Phalaenopsis equestris]|uniref:upstream activation factor subunit spp27-like isoform X2 n=1 Tax=Phalaenopsis equestris TaxID=78828 RepID=UPI0009E5C369|nr:upstream activation factor subunit spp27-like isoform X2 [Phalaenopsis equestris]